MSIAYILYIMNLLNRSTLEDFLGINVRMGLKHKHTYININKIYLNLNIHLYVSISTLMKVITFRL